MHRTISRQIGETRETSEPWKRRVVLHARGRQLNPHRPLEIRSNSALEMASKAFPYGLLRKLVVLQRSEEQINCPAIRKEAMYGSSK